MEEVLPGDVAAVEVCEPYDILPLLRSATTGFQLRRTVDSLPEDDRIRFNLYQIGGAYNRIAVPAEFARAAWVAACKESTRNEFWTQGMRLPCIRCGNGALVSSIKPTCWREGGALKARLSLDFDCIARGDRSFPSPEQIFATACEFLQEHTEVTIDSRYVSVIFGCEPATLFMGANARKWVTAHLIFHHLCQPQSTDHFERAKKNGPLHRKFCAAMEPLGLDADICLTGLRWEFCDKQDEVPADETDRQADDVRKGNHVWRWRRTVMPVAARFNCSEEQESFVSWEELANEIDPHVLPDDVAWNREVCWQRIEPVEPVRAPPPQSHNVSLNLSQLPQVEGVSRQMVSEDDVCAALWRHYGTVYRAPYPAVRTKTFGSGQLMVLPLSDLCPLKKTASSDQPAFHHSSTGKFYAVAHPDGAITAHCHVCQTKEAIRAAPPYVDDAALALFDSDFVRVADLVLLKPNMDAHTLDFSRSWVWLSRQSFLNHARTMTLERDQPWVRIPYRDKPVPPSIYWFANSRYMYDGVVYSPEQEAGGRFFNTWLGFSGRVLHESALMWESSADELLSKWAHTRHHILHNACGGDARVLRAFLGFFVDLICMPWRKPKWGILLYGPQGSGKGLIVEFFAAICGKHNFIHADNRSVAGNFNAAIMDKLLVFADEGIDQTDNSAVAYVKKLVTEVEQTSKQKHVPEAQVETCFRVVVATNEEPRWATGRRWLVLEVPQCAELPTQAIVRERESFLGPAAFYVAAKRGLLDVGDFNAFESMETSRRWDLTVGQFSEVKRYWYDVLRSARHPCADFSGPDVTQAKYGFLVPEGVEMRDFGTIIFEHAGLDVPKILFYLGFRSSVAAARVHENHFWNETIATFGFKFAETHKRVPGTNMRVYCVQLPALETLRAKFCVQMKAPPDIFQ